MSIKLNQFAYLTLEEVKEWLKVKPEEAKFDTKLLRLINTACARVEKYIDGPVLSRTFVEFADGNNSNVIVPSYCPITEITEIKIDFNRNFGSADSLAADNFVLRGLPPLTQPLMGGTSVAVEGTDIVLRDDSNVAVLGRIFSGSVIQSVQMTYKAGRGNTADDLPDDLKTATLMLVDYLYMVTENRELGVGSKGVMGQSYTKKTLGDSGMPEEIEAMLQEYRDYALPNVSMPQRNTFKI